MEAGPSCRLLHGFSGHTGDSAIGYGIRYEYGIFDQQIRDGWQVESTDKWLRFGNPWSLERPEDVIEVKMGGHTEIHTDAQGRFKVEWIPKRRVRGVPHDTPIPGYRTNTVNTMRLWAAQAVESFDFGTFNDEILPAPWQIKFRLRTSRRFFIE